LAYISYDTSVFTYVSMTFTMISKFTLPTKQDNPGFATSIYRIYIVLFIFQKTYYEYILLFL